MRESRVSQSGISLPASDEASYGCYRPPRQSFRCCWRSGPRRRSDQEVERQEGMSLSSALEVRLACREVVAGSSLDVWTVRLSTWLKSSNKRIDGEDKHHANPHLNLSESQQGSLLGVIRPATGRRVPLSNNEPKGQEPKHRAQADPRQHVHTNAMSSAIAGEAVHYVPHDPPPGEGGAPVYGCWGSAICLCAPNGHLGSARLPDVGGAS